MDQVPKRPLAEYSTVITLEAISDRITTVPEGAVGTIVHVHKDGEAYEVEFDQPHQWVLLVRGDQIREL